MRYLEQAQSVIGSAEFRMLSTQDDLVIAPEAEVLHHPGFSLLASTPSDPC
jgi:hypothetical protein